MLQYSSDIIKKLSSLDEQERKLAIERGLYLEKALKSQDVDTIIKAQTYYNNFLSSKQQSVIPGNRKSLIIDPLESARSMGYYYKATMLSFDILRAMSRAPIIRAIINTRKEQISDYCKPQPDENSHGFTFVKNGVNKDDELSDQDKRVIEKLTEFIMNCGDTENEWDDDRDFDTWVRKIMEDSLVLDQSCSEIIHTFGKMPTQFVSVDGASIRRADQTDDNASPIIDGYKPNLVQIWQNRVVVAFYPWELMYGIRNSSTNIKSNGYGRSELEDLIQTVTAMLNADTYNGNFFRNGSAPRGALLIKKAGASSDMLQQFRRDWQAMTSGSQNSHKTPILDAESFEWMDMHINNKDMEFAKFQEYLIKLACAVYKISPEEVGFPLEGSGRASLGGDNGKNEKDYSKDKGLKPLLSKLQLWINTWIVWPKTNKKWSFQFAGMNVESAKEEEERINKAVTTYLTVDEARKDRGLKPLPNGLGKLPLNPILAQMQMSSQQQQQDKFEQDKQQQQQDDTNTNPFLDEDNPIMKGAEQVGEELLAYYENGN